MPYGFSFQEVLIIANYSRTSFIRHAPLKKEKKYGSSKRQKHQYHNSDREANSLSKHSPNFATQKLGFRILTNYWLPPGTQAGLFLCKLESRMVKRVNKLPVSPRVFMFRRHRNYEKVYLKYE